MTTAVTAVVPLDGLDVTVKELTVDEVRAWFVRVDAQEVEFEGATELLFEDCSLAELQLMSNLSSEDAGRFGASALQSVLDKAKALNGFFFRERALKSAVMAGVLRQVLQHAPSNETS